MKKLILISSLVILTITVNAQRYKTIQIGDSLYVNGVWIKGGQEMSSIPDGSMLYMDGDSMSYESYMTYDPVTDLASILNIAVTGLSSYGGGSEILITDDLRFNGNYDILANWDYYITNEFNPQTGYWKISSYPDGNTSETDYLELKTDTFRINFDQLSFSSWFTGTSLQLQTASTWYYQHNVNGAMYFNASSTDTVFWLYPTTNGNTYPLLRLKGSQAYSGQSGKMLLRIDDYSGNRVFEVTGDTTYVQDLLTDDDNLITTADNYSLYVNGSTGTKIIESISNANGDRVTVNDILKLTPRASAPSVPNQGDLYFNSTTSTAYCYDGSTWQALW